MNEQTLFRQTRWRLASWYAGVMGIILAVSGLGVYEAIDHAHRTAADRELQAIAGRLHDNIEPTLQQPGEIPASAQRFLPDPCNSPSQCTETVRAAEHAPGEMFQGNYYIRLLDPSQDLVALAGLKPPGLISSSSASEWQFLKDRDKTRYRQVTLPLQNPNEQLWGYLQVGSSLKDSDRYLSSVRLALFAGLPLALGFVGVAGWWLAGRAMRPIRQSYQQMQQFTADAAHELRTPIAAAQATVESVLDLPQLSEAEARETLQTLDRQNQRLSQLIQDLLLLTRLDRQIQLKQNDACCLQDLVSDIAEELAALALSKKIQLLTDVQVDQPLWVNGDEAQLYRLVFNLVINAIQYTPEGGKVTLALDQQDQQAVIQVQDTGVGIVPEYQAKIFDRFYRVDSDRNRQTGGSGLGLAIASAISQTHGGKISVQSQPGQGSTFILSLPIGSVRQPTPTL
ncbi:two-component system sensor histidine kinase RppB [Acaryochloris sp. CCMEE 5410]|uniref:two-component system sensor histidine kinase RppB n=1 Tax=Acaryochloris sp. CCMEE 5410 TaxID=310037 RepID=UPI0002483EE1|nr:two-component system sensor histidine kinase RppB [Acaryochloris sp. CCMEE 5410]KAI9130085.1 two-component sensor histidine kinase [Acaryochloris sp. CCMEE 5410]